MHLIIGDIETLTVSDFRVVPDDRQTMIETIGGVEVQDFGHIEDGDKIFCTITLTDTAANTLYNYWHNRTFVNVADEKGNSYGNLRVVVKEYGYLGKFRKYYKIKLEFWRK